MTTDSEDAIMIGGPGEVDDRQLPVHPDHGDIR